MKYYFAIQTHNPTFKSSVVEQVESIHEATCLIFDNKNDEAYLLWNWIPVIINYKYDLYVLIDDIPYMLEPLSNSNEGFHRVYWGSDTFNGQWDLEWTDDNLKITSRWYNIAGNYEDLLNSNNIIEINKKDFVSQWKGLLKIIIEAIDKSGIEIKNQQKLDSFRRLEASIPEPESQYIAMGEWEGEKVISSFLEQGWNLPPHKTTE